METKRRTWTVLLVAWDNQWHQKIEFCDCSTLVIRLAAMGFMVCTPTRPHTAFALSLMDYGHKVYMQNLLRRLPILFGSFTTRGVGQLEPKILIASEMPPRSTVKPRCIIATSCTRMSS